MLIYNNVFLFFLIIRKSLKQKGLKQPTPSFFLYLVSFSPNYQYLGASVSHSAFSSS